MSQRLCFPMAVIAALFAMLLPQCALSNGGGRDALVLYVSPSGDDGWSGERPAPSADGTDGPLRTPHRAQEIVRGIKAAEGERLTRPVSVLLRGGVYYLDEPLTFTPEDSGTEACPVTFGAYRGERPILSGGQVIDGWRRGDDGAWMTEVPDVRIGSWYFRQLFVGSSEGGPFHRRYRPTMGAFVIAGLTDAPPKDVRMAHRRSQNEFAFHPGDIKRFENLDDVEVVAIHSWSSSRLRIRGLDMDRRVVKFTGFPVYRIGHWFKGGRNPYYLENVKEAFGKPGEWYLDRMTGKLAYTPMEGEDLSGMCVTAPRRKALLRLIGDPQPGLYVEHLHFRGLQFSHSAWELPREGYSSGQGMTDLPAAIQMQGSANCSFERCTFSHIGTYAIRIGGTCRDNEIRGCRMFDLGAGGAKIGVHGRNVEEPRLPVNNAISNCVISDGGLDHFSAHGIWVGISRGTRVMHNVVRRFGYSTVSVGWSWNDQPTPCRENVIAGNHLHDAMMLLSDGGGIYTLGFQPGTILRGNRIHNIHKSRFSGGAPNNGVFFDQGSKGFLVEGNIIYDTAGKPIRFNQCNRQMHTFRDNSFGVRPEEPEFPRGRAEQAGLEPRFADIDDIPVDVPAPPIYSMSLPPPPPLKDDYESTSVGSSPRRARVHGAEKPASIRVTDETAASGQRSVKFTDAAGLSKPFYPYLVYEPSFDEGIVTVEFAMRVDAGARASIEAREYSGGGFTAGPSLSVRGDGSLAIGDGREMGVPVGEWFRIRFTFALGQPETGTWDLLVSLPGGTTRQFTDLPWHGEGFSRFDWLGFISDATEDSCFYIDDLSVTRKQR